MKIPMFSSRTIKQTFFGRTMVDGAEVRLARLFSQRNVEDFDPFLLLDVFDSSDPAEYTGGFPSHPHRGIECLTYLVEGRMEHEDTLGNKGVITSGGCHWLTTGSGVIHQEMPKSVPHMLGVQLWINMPKKDKMSPPAFQNITPDQVPVVNEKGAQVRIVAGAYKKTPGALQPQYVNVTFLDVTLDSGASWSYSMTASETLFVYVLDGECRDGDDAPLARRQAALFTSGGSVKLKSPGAQTRFLLATGKPIGERVAWGGPVVMNTEEELCLAFSQLKDGTFLK